ncbi:MAG: NUDIX domain-containing protein [Acidimicrobiia bacterium]
MAADAGRELVDVVDAADVVVATVTRAEMRRRNLRHRSVGIVVTDGAGRVLVHRRADDKDVWPGRWDLAVGGVLGAGESYADAATRELAEEIGVEGLRPAEIGRGTYEDGEVAALYRLYGVRHGGPFRFADGEVVEARFVTAAELAERLVRDSWVPDSVALAVPLVPSLLDAGSLGNAL